MMQWTPTGYYTVDPSEGELARPDGVKLFEAGDVVFLLSGGPGMTVVDVCDCGSVSVAWFVADELHEAVFPEDALDYGD